MLFKPPPAMAYLFCRLVDFYLQGNYKDDQSPSELQSILVIASILPYHGLTPEDHAEKIVLIKC